MKSNNAKFLLIITAIASIVALGSCAKSAAEFALNTDSEGNALRGYDAVAYFAVENAVKGNKKFEYAWNGAKWLFSSEENMNKFKADPEAFAPQYGGYCSYAVSEGYTADGDPEAWKVVDGKLYLNYSPEVKSMWEKNEAERIENGKKNWGEFKTKKPQHKG
ncbi:MAG: YHS domain-containing (seleno)protein [Pyrinomonadaceae bacterium]